MDRLDKFQELPDSEANIDTLSENDLNYRMLLERARMSSLTSQQNEIALYGLVEEDHPLSIKVQELYEALDVPEDKRCKIYLIKNQRDADACSYIGGNIFITVGMLKKLPPYEEVWQAILAHEQSHYTENHHDRAIRHASQRKKEAFIEGEGSALAMTRLSEVEADARGSIDLLDKSGINPLGAKVLMQFLSESAKPGFHNASHGSPLDRMLNTETIFGLYDLKSLTGAMKAMDLPDIKNDPGLQQNHRQLARLHRVTKKEQEERISSLNNLSLLEILAWHGKLDGLLKNIGSNPQAEELTEACEKKLSEYLDANYEDLDPEDREELKPLVLWICSGNEKNFPEQESLERLEHFLSSTIWSRLPQQIGGNHLIRLCNAVIDVAINKKLDEETLLGHWPGVLAKHFRCLDANYSEEDIRVLIESILEEKRLREAPSKYAAQAKELIGLFETLRKGLIVKAFGTGKLSCELPSGALKKFAQISANLSQTEQVEFLTTLAEADISKASLDGDLNIGSTFDHFLRNLLTSLLPEDSDVKLRTLKAVLIEECGFFGALDQFENAQGYEDVYLKRDNAAKRWERRDEQYTSTGEQMSYLDSRAGVDIDDLVREKLDRDILKKTNKLLAGVGKETSPDEVVELVEHILNPAPLFSGLKPDNFDQRSLKCIAKKVLCHYLVQISEDKEQLKGVWTRLSECEYFLELLQKTEYSTYSTNFQYLVLKRKDWNLEDPTDCRFLLEFSRTIIDTDHRSRFTTVIVDAFMEQGGFEEKIDHLFGTSAAWVRDFKIQSGFIESEVTSHEKLRLTRAKIEDTLRSGMEDPSAKIGHAALIEQLSPMNPSDMLELALKTRDSDRDLRAECFEYGYRKVEYSPETSGLTAQLKCERSVKLAESLEARLFNASAFVRYMIARNLLVKGERGILYSPEKKRRLFKSLLSGVLNEEEGQAGVKDIIEEVLETIVEIPEWEELFFAIAPIVSDNILLTPEKKTPWSDLYCIEEKFGKTYRQPKKKSELKVGKYDVAPEIANAQLASVMEDFLAGQTQFSKKRERLSPIELIVEVAQHLGAPAVRFLQVMGQYIQIPEEYEGQFVKVYDEVQSQNKLLADVLLEREYAGYREDVEGLHFTAGGGSIMTVFGTSAKGEAGDVLKVRNPNILYRMEFAFGFIEKIVQSLAKKNPQKYAVLQDAFQDITEWIRHDIQDENFLEKDAEFKAQHEGYSPVGSAYKIRVPSSKGPASEYYKRESYAPGLNLTAWNQLEEEGHNMKDVASLLAKNYFTQISTPVNSEGVIRLHADVHPGNFRVDDENNVWILDRNGYLDYDQRDMEFFSRVTTATKGADLVEAVVTYFADDQNESQVREVLEERNIDSETTDFSVVQGILTDLRQVNIKIPLKITLLLKNLNSLHRFALKAGFEGGLHNALAYNFSQEEDK